MIATEVDETVTVILPTLAVPVLAVIIVALNTLINDVEPALPPMVNVSDAKS